jgi:integrase
MGTERMGPSESVKRVTGHLKLVERREGPVWYAKTRVPGRRPEQTTRRLGPAHLGGGKPARGRLTRKQAEDALADLLAKARHDVGQGAYDIQPDGATFADVAAEFLHHLRHVKGREESTLHDYRGSINHYLEPRWGERPVVSIRSAEVEALRDELLAAGLAPRTVVRHLTVTHGIFKHAMRKHGLGTNPASAELVDRPSVKYTGEFTTLNPSDELPALIRAAYNDRDAVLYRTAAMTGLRKGELLALRWRDLDFAGQRIHARRAWDPRARVEKAPKSGKVRSVPMVLELVAPLDKLSRRARFTGPEDLVFCDDFGEHLNIRSLRDRYKTALRRAGLPDIRFHDLRHLFGSVAVKEFVLSDVQAMLGHAHVSTTMRYVHHRPGADDAAKLSRAFSGESVGSERSATKEAPGRVPS